MDITKVRSGIHRPTRVHRTKRRRDMDLLEDFRKEAYNDSIDAYEDLEDRLIVAGMLLNSALIYVPTDDPDLIWEIKDFLKGAP